MFQQLTKYLTQYKQVSIPEVGSFELVYRSATLDIGKKLVQPPSYFTNYSDSDLVKDHQLNILAQDLNTDKPSVEKLLQQFGSELKRRIQSESFIWKGIGILEKKDSQIFFHPDVPHASWQGLQPVKAEKVLRDDAMHTVLVGEREVRKSHLQEGVADSFTKRSALVIIGWILAVLAIAFIVFMLYRGGFQSTSTGSKWEISPSTNQPTHK